MSRTAVERIAAKVGGLAELGRICGVDPSQPCHWNRPRSVKNGRGGSIPDRYHERIIAHFTKRGLPLKKAELVNA